MNPMDKPKYKYWKMDKNDIGREVGNPDYVTWASWKISRLEAENAKLRKELKDTIELAEMAMKMANNDGGEFDIDDHLSEAHAAIKAPNHRHSPDRLSSSGEWLALE